MSDTNMVSENLPEFVCHRSLVSKSKFPNRSDLNEIDKFLHQSKAIGRLVIHYSQGGRNAIVFEEDKPVGDATSITVK